MTTKHTEEPWKVVRNKNPKNIGEQYMVMLDDGDAYHILATVCYEENAKRIVTCVNALAGIDDVEGFMATVKSMLQWGIAIERPNRELDNRNYLSELEKALALFPTVKENLTVPNPKEANDDN